MVENEPCRVKAHNNFKKHDLTNLTIFDAYLRYGFDYNTNRPFMTLQNRENIAINLIKIDLDWKELEKFANGLLKLIDEK